jgi:hypothetical protein
MLSAKANIVRNGYNTKTVKGKFADLAEEKGQ